MSTLIERETSAGSEGARRATGDPAGRAAAGVPDPEVSEQAKRRRFKAEYKLQIVREANACNLLTTQSRVIAILANLPWLECSFVTQWVY